MLVKIEGLITKKDPMFLVIKSGSLSYGIFISLQLSSQLKVGDEKELLITQIIKEDSNKLYGFLDEDEQAIFNSLLKVKGVGAATAMAICSSFDTKSFFKALSMNDIKAFTAVPGIGLKGAKLIIAELGDEKLGFEIKDELKSKARAALLSLGFKEEKIAKVLAKIQKNSLEETIKEALKLIRG